MVSDSLIALISLLVAFAVIVILGTIHYCVVRRCLPDAYNQVQVNEKQALTTSTNNDHVCQQQQNQTDNTTYLSSSKCQCLHFAATSNPPP